MESYSNAQILGAVLGKFIQPLIKQIGLSRLSGIPALGNLEAKIKSTGWVSNDWTIVKELSPFAEAVTNALLVPIVTQVLAEVPDDAIPEFIHGIVDKGLEEERLELLEGNITFDKEDLKRLKALLDINLPCKQESYIVKDVQN